MKVGEIKGKSLLESHSLIQSLGVYTHSFLFILYASLSLLWASQRDDKEKSLSLLMSSLWWWGPHKQIIITEWDQYHDSSTPRAAKYSDMDPGEREAAQRSIFQEDNNQSIMLIGCLFHLYPHYFLFPVLLWGQKLNREYINDWDGK